VRGAAGVEAGALNQHVDGIVLNLGIHAAHDAGKSDGALAVSDQRHALGQGALHIVQGAEGFALVRGANHYGTLAVALGEGGQIECVQRLAGKHHHIVGDVDDVVVGTDAASVQALHQPLGRRANLHVANDAGNIAAAEVLVGKLNRDLVGGGAADLGIDSGQLHVEVAVVDGADLAGDADHGKAVGAVGRDLAVEHGIGGAVVLGERHAHGSVLGQDHNARMVAGKPQLASGAVHAHGNHAAQLALLDLDVARQLGADHGGHNVVALVEVLGAADNLQGLGITVGVHVAGAHVNLGDPHMVGVRVRLLGKHLCSHNVVKGLAHGLDSLDLGTGANEFGRELGRILRNLDHAGKPVV